LEIVIKEAGSKKEIREFVHFPRKLYKSCPYWVPQLDIDEFNLFDPLKNPAYEFCEVRLFLACKDGNLVGRIAGIINHKFIEKWQANYLRFGWLDFVDNREVSKALLDTVETWAIEKKMDGIHGPLGFTDLDPEGMLIEGFEELATIATIYNYPYYPDHLEDLGYNKDIDWLEYEIQIPKEVPEKIARIAHIVEQRQKLRVLRAKSKSQLRPYLMDMFSVLNSAYNDLYGFVPLNEKQIDRYIKQYVSYLNPEFLSLVLNEDERVVAFGLTLPSLSRAYQKAKGKLFPFGIFYMLYYLNYNKMTDLYLVAVRPDYQNKGVNALIFADLINFYIKHKYKTAESNPELESNSRVQALWRSFNRRQHKRRRCFLKEFKKL
jgi:GNAT superfamily N-acetyltransferase